MDSDKVANITYMDSDKVANITYMDSDKVKVLLLHTTILSVTKRAMRNDFAKNKHSLAIKFETYDTTRILKILKDFF